VPADTALVHSAEAGDRRCPCNIARFDEQDIGSIHMQFRSACQDTVRRRLLRAFGWAALSLALPFSPAAWASAPRSISLYHTHTSERLSLVYYEDGEYIADALASLNGLLRDFRTGETCQFDAALFDQMHALNLACGEGTYEVVSAYRSEQTNRMLREQSKRVAKDSLHVRGRPSICACRVATRAACATRRWRCGRAVSATTRARTSSTSTPGRPLLVSAARCWRARRAGKGRGSFSG